MAARTWRFELFYWDLTIGLTLITTKIYRWKKI